MSALLLSFVLLLSACKGDKTEDASSSAPSVSVDGTVVTPGAASLDPVAALGLQIRATGGSGQVPTQIAFVGAKPLFANRPRGEAAPTDTEVMIDPPVAGELKVDASDALVFVPRDGFHPSTTYTIEVRSFGDGPDRVVPPEPWTLRFETPAFGYVRTTLKRRDDKAGTFTVQSVYSAAVDAKQVGAHTTFHLDGKQLAPAGVMTGDDEGSVVFQFRSKLPPDEDAELEVTTTEGVPWIQDASLVAPAKRETIAIGHGPLVEIRGVQLVESGSGFHIDVGCDDDAAPGAKRSFYDRSTWVWYDELSSRCVLSEESLRQHVRTVPATELQVSSTLAGFRLSGKLARGPLKVQIDAGATTLDGGLVAHGSDTTLDVPARTASVSFRQSGRYLPRSAWSNLGIQHLNTPGLLVAVRHVRPENLVFWMTGNEAADARTSEVVAQTTVAVNSPPDQDATSWIDVQTLVPEPESGLYEIRVSNPDGSSVTSSRLVLTDLQLIAKSSAPPAGQAWPSVIDVWALDAHSGSGVPGTDIQVVRASGQSLGECKTGAAGACTVPVRSADVDSSPPMALIARKGTDITFLELADLQIENTASDVEGAPYTEVTPYRASVLTDRGVIRPGETLHATTVVRDAAFLAAEAVPVVVKVVDPRNREIRRIAATTNPGGIIVSDIATGDYAATGRYRIHATIGDVPIGEATFQVEEFVPERMKVTASIEPKTRLAGEPVDVRVDARWLFGGMASGSQTELRCRIEAASFAPPQAKGFHFGAAGVDADRPRPITLESVTGQLDEQGFGTFTCPPTASLGTMGPAKMFAQAAVFEGETGRTTVADTQATIHPERFAIGLKSGSSKSRRGEPIRVQGVITDWEGKAYATPPAQIEVEIFHLEEEYTWWWDEDAQDSRQTRLLRRARDERRTETLQGAQFELSVTPSMDSAGTLILVKAGAAGTELFVEGTARNYYWEEYGDGEAVVDATPKPARPTPLLVEAPEQVEVGQTVSVSTRVPYKGRMLWTVETDEVLKKQWMDVDAGEVRWSFPVEALTPNVYVTALLIKDPHLESTAAYFPDRAYGITSITVAPTQFLHGVTLKAPESVRPYSPLEVEVDLGPLKAPAYVTVAAVDEGILQLTKFEDPDPRKAIFAKRALGVSTFETIGWTLLAQPVSPQSHTGGDASGSSGRVQMVKPVALWSGLVEVPTSGKAKVRFDVPGYRGQLRVMAVTADKGHIGHASVPVTVKDPLVLQTTLPRFLIGGDVASIPVMVSNESGAPQEVTVAMTVTELETGAKPDHSNRKVPPPPIELIDTAPPPLRLEPGKSGTVVLRVRARALPGAAHFAVTATAGSLVSKEELDLPIFSNAGIARETRTTRLHAGANTVDVGSWVEGSDTSTLWVTSNPYANALVHLRELVRYPFG